MDRSVYRYRFTRSVSMQEVEQSLLLAILAVECLHGASPVRLDARYSLTEEKRACVIDATTGVGEDLNRIFTGFVIKEFGEDAFSVRRIATAGQAGEVAQGTTE